MPVIDDGANRALIRSGTVRIDVSNQEFGVENLPFPVRQGQSLLLTTRCQTNGPSGPNVGGSNVGPLFSAFHRPNPADPSQTQVLVYDIQANRFTASFLVDYALFG